MNKVNSVLKESLIYFSLNTPAPNIEEIYLFSIDQPYIL